MTKMKLIFIVAVFASLSVFADTAEQKKTRVAAVELMNIMQFQKMLDNMAVSMSGQMPVMLKQMLEAQPEFSKMSARMKEKAIEGALRSFEKSEANFTKMFRDPEIAKGVEDIMVDLYTKHFSHDEIKSITAFYKSPAGQKTITIMPQLMADSMPQIANLILPRAKMLGEGIAKDALAMAQAAK
jgi:hypothetical protein